MHYFDYQNASKPELKSLEYFLEIESQAWGNPTMPYRLTSHYRDLMKEAYDQLYALVDADVQQDSFVFTSSGAEAINHVVLSTYLEQTLIKGKKHFLCSGLSESPTILSMTRLEDKGCSFEMLMPNQETGLLEKQELIEKLSPSTALVSLNGACGVTGIVQPIEELIEVCRERGVLVHVDVTHMLGRGALSFRELGCDFITFHGEQLGAPRGCGGLFIRRGVSLEPLIYGGNEQGKLRGGNFSLGLLCSLGKAAEHARSRLMSDVIQVGQLRAFFEKNVCERFPFVEVVGGSMSRVPHISTLLFHYMTSDTLLYSLVKKRVFATMGGGYFQQIAYLLPSYGVDPRIARTGLSFSFHPSQSKNTLEDALQLLFTVVEDRMRIAKKLVEELV